MNKFWIEQEKEFIGSLKALMIRHGVKFEQVYLGGDRFYFSKRKEGEFLGDGEVCLSLSEVVEEIGFD